MDSSITAYFGGDTSGLDQSTKEASIMIKGFSTAAGRAVSEIGQGFLGAVVIMEAIKGIKDLGAAAITSAEQEQAAFAATGKAISDQGQAWLDLKGATEGAGGGIKDFLTGLISIPLIAGEAFGTLINDMRGISPTMTQQWEQSAAAADVATAKMTAAYAAAEKSLPAEHAKAVTELAALDAQYDAAQTGSQDKLADADAAQQTILNKIVADNQVLSGLEADGLDTAQNRTLIAKVQHDLDNDHIELAKNSLEIQKAQTQATQDEIKAGKQKYETSKDTMTSEQQVTALVAQQVFYMNQLGAVGNTIAQNNMLEARADAAGVEATKIKDAYNKSISLSVADQLAMFSYQTGSLSGVNAISKDQYNVLVAQSAELKSQVDLEQALAIYKTSGSAADKEALIAAQHLNAVLTQRVAIAQQQVAADTQDVSEVKTLTADEIAAKLAELNDNASFGSVQNTGTDTYTGGGVGYGSEQIQNQFTVDNYTKQLTQEIDSLGKTISQYQSSDVASEEAQVPAMQAQLSALTEQLHSINISTGNITGYGPGWVGGGPTPVPNSTISQGLIQTTNDTLTGISGQLQQLLSPAK